MIGGGGGELKKKRYLFFATIECEMIFFKQEKN